MKFKIEIKKWILIIISAIIISIAIYVNNCIVVNSFEQCLYAIIKLEGSSALPFINATIYVIGVLILLCPILLLPVIEFGKKFVIKIKNRDIQIYPIKNTRVYGSILFVISIIVIMHVVKMFPFIKNTIFSSTDLFDNYYVDGSNVDITFPSKKKNLIYIFVESLEASNVSSLNGGYFEESIIPNLEQMALDNISFSNTDKIGGAYPSYGTGWTSSAMIAQTSGVPVKLSFDDFSPNSNKFGNVTSIGDILSSNGYNSYLLIGSDADFGGRRGYFANHDYLISDYYSAIDEERIDKDYYEWWGYEDSKLFEYAKDKLLDISKEDRPFNLTMLTADTHFTDGYLDKSCDSKFDDEYYNSFYCSDNMINEFVNWIKEQDFYDDTVIVIVGDHATMQNNFYDEYYTERTIYNVFINTDIDYKYDNKNRIFTTMDLFPTTIAALGADINGDRIGLGTNLFSGVKTIPEIMGINKFNNELMKSSFYYYNYIKR